MKALVVGLGESGFYVSQLLRKKGFDVTVVDRELRDDLLQKALFLRNRGIFVILGKEPLDALKGVSLVVVSPSVKPFSPLIVEAKRLGKDVVSEVQVAMWYADVPIVAITGTNGKTTTSMLIYEIFKNAGLNAFLGGNIGIPLSKVILENGKYSAGVVELSSFQLKFSKKLSPHVAIFLNISPDHLDWHTTFSDYLNSKLKIFHGQSPSDFSILNGDCAPIVENFPKNCSKCLTFSKELGDVTLHKHTVFSSYSKNRYDVSNFAKKGTHNLENAMAAILAAECFGIDKTVVEYTIGNFSLPKHRCEYIGSLYGVSFYNDSKSTNPDSLKRAIELLEKDIVLILGGKDKGFDYRSLRPLFMSKVKAFVFIGEIREKLADTFCEFPYRFASSMMEAVACAFQLAQPGDSVLLSPGTSSFDMFKSFEERGEEFKKSFYKLKKLFNLHAENV